MKIKKLENIKINEPPILKFKPRKYQAALKRKLKRFDAPICGIPTQNWEITNSIQSNSIAEIGDKIKDISIVNYKKDPPRPIHNCKKACVSKTVFEQRKSNLNEAVSIIKMSSDSFVINTLKNKFYDSKHTKNNVTSLKCLMFENKDSSSSNYTNCIKSPSNTLNTPINNLSNEQCCPKGRVTIFDSSKKEPQKTHLKEYPLIVNFQNTETTAVDVCELNGFRFLVVLKPESYFYFIGIIELELLKGSVEILGYTLNKQKKKLLIFSPQGSCHLDIKAKKYSGHVLQNSQQLSIDQLCLLGLSEEKSLQVMKEAETCTLIIIGGNKTHISSSVWPKLFENHHSFSIFPPDDMLNDEKRPSHIFERQVDSIFSVNLNKIGLKQFSEVPEWSVAVEDITNNDCPRTILCGGKSVGKSTLLRYLINKCLQKWDQVLVLDFDLGQCEFTIGGCISVVLVENPVLGPNYTHLKQPLRSVFLGEIDVTKCPENYIDGCKSLIDFSKQNHNNVPWLINTMGFTKGFGVTLTCGIITNVNPTHVIEIESKKMNLNFPSRLSPGFVHSQNVDSFSTNGKLTNYKFFTVPSGAEQIGNNSSKARGMSPSEARNLVLLSYFGEMLNSEITNLTQVSPLMIHLDKINLQTTNKDNLTKAQLSATMNGNLVALCILNEGDRFPHCPGFGIVRGIDEHSGTIYLITPMARVMLSKINCLVKGNIALPESLHLSQGKVTSPPYLVRTSGGPTSRFAKRDFRMLPVTHSDRRRQH